MLLEGARAGGREIGVAGRVCLGQSEPRPSGDDLVGRLGDHGGLAGNLGAGLLHAGFVAFQRRLGLQ